MCPIPRRHQQKCMEHTPPQAWPVHRSADPAVEEVEQARTGGCKRRLGHNIIPVTSTTAGWGSSCGPHSAPEGSLRDSLRIRFCQLLAAPLPAGTAEGRPSAPSPGDMRRTTPPTHFKIRAQSVYAYTISSISIETALGSGLHSLAYRLAAGDAVVVAGPLHGRRVRQETRFRLPFSQLWVVFRCTSQLISRPALCTAWAPGRALSADVRAFGSRSRCAGRPLWLR